MMSRFLTKLLFMLFLCGCEQLSPCKSKETMRISSPDKVLDAVIIESDCGATTPYTDTIYVVPKNKKIDGDVPVFKADHAEDILIIWTKDKYLEINYRKARIFSFTNFWQSKEVDNFDYIVNITEKQKLQ